MLFESFLVILLYENVLVLVLSKLAGVHNKRSSTGLLGSDRGEQIISCIKISTLFAGFLAALRLYLQITKTLG